MYLLQRHVCVCLFCRRLYNHLCCLTFNYNYTKKLYVYQQFSYVFFRFLSIFFTEEQERVQKKTFTNWINSYLLKVSYLSIFNVNYRWV